jgi:hypothetical protein
MFFITMSAAYCNLGASTSGVRDRARSRVYAQPQRCPWKSQDSMPISTTLGSRAHVFPDQYPCRRRRACPCGRPWGDFHPSTVPREEVDTFFHGAAPELIEPQRFRLTSIGATAATDVYAFGVLAFEVSRGRARC